MRLGLRMMAPESGAAPGPPIFKDWQKPLSRALYHHGENPASTTRRPTRITASLPPGSIERQPSGGCGPFPEQPYFPALWAKQSKVSGWFLKRACSLGLTSSWHPYVATADSLCSVEASGSLPVSGVTKQSEFRQSALGEKKCVVCLGFSSNCSPASSAGKIFQNKP